MLNKQNIWRLRALEFEHILLIQQRLLDFAESNELCAKNPSFDLEICDDKKIAQLNYEFLACFGPTNVLSFPNNNQELGIIYLSIDTLHREAKLYAQDLDNHFKHLLCHGFAHLLAFEHGEEMDSLCVALEGEISFIS